MAVCYHEQQLNTIKKLLQKKSFNSYFHKVIGGPQIDEDLLLMMFISLEDTNLSNSRRDSYIAAAMLVQLALDTHEKVAYPDALIKERQLNVLAGDYFSGMYYSILAQLESVELISTLASAIKTVNEHKITLNQKDGITFESFMHSYKEVEIVILERFSLHFQSTKYIGLFNEFLYLKKLVAEYDDFHNGKQGLFFERLIKQFIHKEGKMPYAQLSESEIKKLNRLSYRFMAESNNKLNEMIDDMPALPPVLLERIQKVLSKIQDLTKSSVKEG